MSHLQSVLLALLSLSFLAACHPEPGVPSPDEDVIVRADGGSGDDDEPVVEDEDEDEDTDEDTITLSKTEYEALLARLSAVEAAVAANDPAPILRKVEALKLVVNDSVSWLDQRVTVEETATTAIVTRIEALEPLNGSVAGLFDTAEEHAARLDATEHVDTTLTAKVTTLETKVSPLPAKVTALEAKTKYLKVEQRDGHPAVVFAGVNVVVHNGETGDQLNGKGNLIVGHNKVQGEITRTGSHNLVIGRFNSYLGASSLIVGTSLYADGMSHVVFGSGNKVVGSHNTILGGLNNETQNSVFMSMLGGEGNYVGGGYATHLGGKATRSTAGWAIHPLQ